MDLSIFCRKTNHPWEKTCEITFNKVVKYLNLSHFTKREAWEELKKTFEFAYEIYLPYKRKNGEPVFQHVIRSLENLMLVHPDISTIQLCLLHEVFERDLATQDEIKERFGEVVCKLVCHFTELSKVRLNSSHPDQVENLRQMLLVLADDIRVILVKLSTRLEGMATVSELAPEKQRRIANEILEIYGPISARLGVYALKTRLEDAAFEILEPEMYQKIKSTLETELKENADIIEVCKQQIQHVLKQHRMKGTVHGRVKSIYSIAFKMKDKHLEHVSELYDIFALRVIVPTKEDCYRIFGYIHEHCFPIAKRIKDYISLPKTNQYQSLHTTVTGLYPKNPLRPVEIQIRTQWMDDIAEYGIASHSVYKERGNGKNESYEEWQKRLAELNKDFATKGRFLENESKEVGQLIERVFVVATNGEIKGLPKGATPLDFAYALDPEIGAHCASAKVNGSIVPLSYSLKTGDVVEIITRADHLPTNTSLLYAHTLFARKKIKNYLYALHRDVYVRDGKKRLQQQLIELHLPRLEDNLELLSKYFKDLKEHTLHEKEDILFKIGCGELKTLNVIRKMFPDAFVHEINEDDTAVYHNAQNDTVEIGGHSGIHFWYAGCCNAKNAHANNQELVAYINQRHQIRLHRKDCHFLLSLEKDHKDQIFDVQIPIDQKK
ncbi:MAG: RelA/SpoT family protein [Candidatus Gracilibacteria bacterium]